MDILLVCLAILLVFLLPSFAAVALTVIGNHWLGLPGAIVGASIGMLIAYAFWYHLADD